MYDVAIHKMSGIWGAVTAGLVDPSNPSQSGGGATQLQTDAANMGFIANGANWMKQENDSPLNLIQCPNFEYLGYINGANLGYEMCDLAEDTYTCQKGAMVTTSREALRAVLRERGINNDVSYYEVDTSNLLTDDAPKLYYIPMESQYLIGPMWTPDSNRPLFSEGCFPRIELLTIYNATRDSVNDETGTVMGCNAWQTALQGGVTVSQTLKNQTRSNPTDPNDLSCSETGTRLFWSATGNIKSGQNSISSVFENLDITLTANCSTGYVSDDHCLSGVTDFQLSYLQNFGAMSAIPEQAIREGILPAWTSEDPTPAPPTSGWFGGVAF